MSTTTVETLQYAGQTYLAWTCPVCEKRVERILSGRPWYCSECSFHDRSVEMQAERIDEIERRAEETDRSGGNT